MHSRTFSCGSVVERLPRALRARTGRNVVAIVLSSHTLLVRGAGHMLLHGHVRLGVER